jgi:hypothetical protein
MSEATPEGAAAPEAQTGLTDDHAQALLADALSIAEQENGTRETGSSLPDDPESLRAEIARLRRENGAARTNAKAQAADEARTEFAQQIGKILGLVKDEPVDPAALTEQLTATQAQARQAQVELAVFRAAAGTPADPAALLDSRSFLAKVADIDPSDGDAIKQAISEVIESNPRLGKATTPGMKPNPAQGRSASPPLGLADQIAAAQKAGDMKTVLRLKAAQAVSNSS